MVQLMYILCTVIAASTIVDGFTWDRSNIERLFANSESIFKELVTADDEKRCVREFKHFVDELKLSTVWAEEVMDTWAKEPNGLHSEISIDFGHFDQCIRLPDQFQKQHCQIKVENYRNMSYTLGVCIPNSCQDKTVYKILKPFFENVEVSVVSASFCQNGENPPLGILQYFVLLIFASLILATSIGTYQELKGCKTPFTSFSLHHNINRLCEQKSDSSSMKCLNGIKVISMFWIVFLHAYYEFFYIFNLYNPNDMKQFHYTFTKAFLRHGDLAVDTFLVVSGLLLAYNFIKTQESGGAFNIFNYYLHRYLRLIPVFAIVMLIILAFANHVGNGPEEYKWTSYYMLDGCKKYWWSALLLMQNYVNPTNMCIASSWYISVDMQLYILSPLFLFSLIKYGRRFYIILVIICLASIGYMFLYIYYNDLHFDSDPMVYTPYVYLPAHARIGQWLIGVALGNYLYKTREETLQINKKLNIFLWIISSLTLVIVIYIPYTQYRGQTENVLIFALYTALHRILWALAVSWIIFACIKGHGGPVNWFLSFPFFQPLAKLSYAIYIIHFPVERQIATLQRSLAYFSFYTMFHFFLGILTLSLLLAIPVVLMVEMPVLGLEPYIYKSFKMKNEIKKQ